MFTFVCRQLAPCSGRRSGTMDDHQQNATKLRQGNGNAQMLQEKTPDILLITINDRQIEQMNSTRLLGVTMLYDLARQLYIDDITAKGSQRLYCVILFKRAGENLIISSRYKYHNRPLRHRVRLPDVSYEPYQKQFENIQKGTMCIIFRVMS